jgi:uncharacterized protein (TIGR00255 family)
MTGFGAASISAGGVALHLELKSVNSRHLKLNFRLPMGAERWEQVLREEIAARLGRGHVDVTVRLAQDSGSGSEEARSVRLDEDRVRAYLAALRKVKERWDLPGEIDIGLVGRCERLLVESTVDPYDSIDEESVRRVAREATEQLIQMRRREGERLAEDLLGRVAALESGLADVEALAPGRLEREAERLRRSIRELASEVGVDEDRMVREIAFIADKWDISEEIVRARSHLSAFRDLVDAPDREPVGKRLGFLGQELLREVNTIGSKANDSRIARLVVDMKNELEALREQNENVE